MNNDLILFNLQLYMMRKSFLIFSVFFSLVIIVFHSFIGLNFEFLESNIPSMLSGKINNDFSLNHMFFSAHYPLADWVYIPLYKLISPYYFPFYETFMYAFIIVSGSIIAYVVSEKIKKTPNYLHLLFTTTCSLIYFFLIINLQHTVVAFLLCLAASSLLYLDIDDRSKQEKLLINIAAVSLFALGLMIRFQVGILFSIIIFVAWLVLRLNNRIALSAIIPIILITVVLYGVIMQKRALSNDYCQKMDLVIGHQLMDRGNIIPISEMHSYEDSIKYLSVIQPLSDPEYLSIDFIESLIAFDPVFGIDQRFFVRTFDIFKQYVGQQKGLLLIYISIVIITIFTYRKNKTQALRWVLFNLFFWSLIILTIYSIKMELRVFRSIFFTLIIFHCINIPTQQFKHRFLIQLLSPIILYGFVSFIQFEISFFNKNRENTLLHKKLSAEIAQKYPNRIIVPGMNLSSVYMANFFPFERPDFSAHKHIFLFDTDTFFWQENYNNWVKKECNCDTGDMVSFLDYLSENDAVYIGSKERTQAIQTYCSDIRKTDYNFNILDSLQSNGEWNYYFSINRDN